MAPSWPSRLLAGSASQPSSRSTSYTGSSKPLPRTPTLPPSDTSLPPRPPTAAGGSPAHTHSRSVSHPLPRLFSRKKSLAHLSGSRDDVDVSLDEGLVPVLVEGDPKRTVSAKTGEEDGKVQRRCGCCDARVRVPREVGRFRCMGCLMVNEVETEGLGKEKEDFKSEISGLSVERTRRVVERCVAGYLEVRCRRATTERTGQSAGAGSGPVTERSISEGATIALEGKARTAVPIEPSEGRISKQLTDAPVSSSPLDMPDAAGLPAMNQVIGDFGEFDLFADGRRGTPPPPTAKLPVSGIGPSLPNPISPRRKPVPGQPVRSPPLAPLSSMTARTPSLVFRPHNTANGERSPRLPPSPRVINDTESRSRHHHERAKLIFRPLEDYIVSNFGSFENLNASFSTIRPVPLGRTKSDSHISTPPPERSTETSPSPMKILDGMDAKTLLLGDIGENGSWWAGRLPGNVNGKAIRRKKVGGGNSRAVSSKSPNIDWQMLEEWFELVHSAGEGWRDVIPLLSEECDRAVLMQEDEARAIEADLAEAREHTIRALLKVTENMLKRPGRVLRQPEDLRWLLILLANPSLHAEKRRMRLERAASNAAANAEKAFSPAIGAKALGSMLSKQLRSPRDASIAAHTGIVKRILGLLANAPESNARYLTTWFSRLDSARFTSLIDLVASFLTHRLARRSTRSSAHRPKRANDNGGLIPNLSNGAASTSVQLHSALGLSGSTSTKKRDAEDGDDVEWAADWQLRAAARVMSILFTANDNFQGARASTLSGSTSKPSTQLLPTNYFYTTLLDSASPALIADFKLWESLPSLPPARARDKFAFCQYPFLLSLGAKIRILEFDARRQMELKAREAYFDAVVRARGDGDGGQHFHLRVRRDCMVDDSLQQIASAVGAGGEDVKKGLRVRFEGEEGVDAGGLRKEWFLLLVREVFDAEHGLFLWDEDCGNCWFNPGTFETGEEYFLVGALLGLAIYNSTILDVALPSFAWRKLLAASPAGGNASTSKSSLQQQQMSYTLSDLAELHPSLAKGLQQLLDFSGNVEETYCWTFTAPIHRYGIHTTHPLLPSGETIPVTNSNRDQFVDLYIRYLLDGAVTRQFEPFKRGFWTVCAGNALSLFRAEEIELLVRGSEEAELDVATLRAVAVYENFRSASPPHHLLPDPASLPVVEWFWDLFASAPAVHQRKLLAFVTGSDRIPALGAASLVLRIAAGGKGWGEEGRERFPSARTCFNMVTLWGYESKEVMKERLWRAVEEGEGFGLK